MRTVVRKYYRLALPALQVSSTKDVAHAPLFVIGSGRSGNTLVRRVLLASGQIYIPPETYVLGDIIETWPYSALLPWRQRVWLFCAHFERHPHFATFGLDNLGQFATEAASLKRRSLPILIDAFFRFLAREAGYACDRWGDKTPWNTNHLPAIGATFPQARYLWLIRDGRDVALSYQRAGLYPDLRSAAVRWEQANRACARFARWAPHVYKVRYEDLVSAPEREFSALFDWAGLTFDAGVLDARPDRMGDVEALAHHAAVTKQISTKSIGSWRKAKLDDELAALSPGFHNQIGVLGYGD